jgi:hypothetical protein
MFTYNDSSYTGIEAAFVPARLGFHRQRPVDKLMADKEHVHLKGRQLTSILGFQQATRPIGSIHLLYVRIWQ